MERLIDANNLIRCDNENLKEVGRRSYETLIKCVRNEPTAFDKEKVIEQLKAECVKLMNRKIDEDTYHMYSKGAQTLFVQAVKIIEKGGID